ncbi:methyl-accepting chemotaxis protein [Acidocella aminolytica]|uniref:Chemotaxis sensory transducer McpH n=1 Tax=Acidocella aminolytica 101 = DSM 11237 TaxID=1120923 RepID=A0A0D6PE84_9PROT|nr:PAS domain-containing methyl-accepting chemotaxis protein [Acidocella aminolytica]GAN79518.1 chemotaxis sensory transducer McpH [Acidocella aminolytica 101 = DSM 11237]GBQ32625.1 methyl-accepting chemotaxis protein [Acidocella aminolytica 101 = DSM 11237]SHF34676.1 methyl-accepting chemotaxis sensory transducer with Pas/Pac sensor [Acidocella aminolytica 101 = DSM 11237]
MFRFIETNTQATLKALSLSLAIIEFSPDGTILTANDNFCRLLGYNLSEIKGKHHSLFVDPAYAQSAEYQEFWKKLRRGEYEATEYRRIAKDGHEVWLQASYNPVRNSRGTVVKVIKQATDVTADKLRIAAETAILDAISRAQAMIEFTVDGKIITANENFLKAMGYRLDEIKGQKHRIFVEQNYGQSPEYAEFWKKLASGEYIAAEFKRIGKGGKQVWLQASYNPIFDLNNKVVKVVKFATDVTDRVRAVNGITTGLKELASKNLKYRIIENFSVDFQEVRQDFNSSLEQLESTMAAISASIQNVKSSSGEISQASDDLSRRTEQQAASLEETAAALDQITTTVANTAESAGEARNVVNLAKDDAERSAIVVTDTVNAMTEIEHSSSQISNIIGVIDEIAFQTNLLALNAGVEAARAGDAGRGFAVVATEVRALAQRSAEAAKEIKALISSSTQQVATGVALVGKTGKALQGIAEHVTKLNGMISEITASTREQSSGLSQVNVAVNEMDQVTQKNAAMVEETTAASHSLTQEARELAGLVGQFHIGATSRAQPSVEPELSRKPTKLHAQERHSRVQHSIPKRPLGNSGDLVAVGAEPSWDEF